MRHLRILHVSPYGPSAWAYGGIPRIVGALTRGLAARGHTVTICTTDVCNESTRVPRDQGVGPAVAGGVNQITFKNVSNRLAYRQQGFLPVGLRWYLRRHASNFDVAHLHACRNLPGAIAAYYLRRAGVPYVLQPNGTAPVIERRRAAKHVFDLVAGERILANAARVIAVSPAEQRQLAAQGVPQHVLRSVGNPIDLAEFQSPINRGSFRRQWSIDGPIVLFLGKITPRKNVSTLVRAFNQLACTNATLVVAGNDMGGGDHARAIARELQIDSRVVFTGLLPGSARIHALADADVVVYASEHEIFGLVPFEALLAGTPVVVADDSGCGDLVGATGGGLVVPVNDVHALTRAIDDVLAYPAIWRGKAQHAQSHIRRWYGADVVCGELESVYRELVNARQESGDALKGVPYRYTSRSRQQPSA
jgi:glycosyltransferase involved in cell wall biosynthesis